MKALAVMGQAYAEGRLSVGEVAVAVGVSPSDAAAFLERHGFARTPEAQRLSDEQRTAALQRLRAERLSRNGTPFVSQELIARDGIATERIEGVDARAWPISR